MHRISSGWSLLLTTQYVDSYGIVKWNTQRCRIIYSLRFTNISPSIKIYSSSKAADTPCSICKDVKNNSSSFIQPLIIYILTDPGKMDVIQIVHRLHRLHKPRMRDLHAQRQQRGLGQTGKHGHRSLSHKAMVSVEHHLRLQDQLVETGDK